MGEVCRHYGDRYSLRYETIQQFLDPWQEAKQREEVLTSTVIHLDEPFLHFTVRELDPIGA